MKKLRPYGQSFSAKFLQRMLHPQLAGFEGTEVEIFRRGDEVVLRPRPTTGAAVFDLLSRYRTTSCRTVVTTRPLKKGKRSE